MPKREIIVRLEDIRRYIDEAQIMVTEVKGFKDYLNSRTHQLAFERAFELIGEALYHVRKERPDIEISDINKIIGLRHLLAHEYYEIEQDRLWIAATINLPVLKHEIELLIDEENLKLFGTTNPNLD